MWIHLCNMVDSAHTSEPAWMSQPRMDIDPMWYLIFWNPSQCSSPPGTLKLHRMFHLAFNVPFSFGTFTNNRNTRDKVWSSFNSSSLQLDYLNSVLSYPYPSKITACKQCKVPPSIHFPFYAARNAMHACNSSWYARWKTPMMLPPWDECMTSWIIYNEIRDGFCALTSSSGPILSRLLFLITTE